MGQLVSRLGVSSNVVVQNMPAAARRILIFQFLRRCEKGLLAKVIRDWLHFSTQTRQPGWRASPWEPGSAFHPYKLLSQGLSCMNLISHWSRPSPAGGKQSSVKLVATHKHALHFLGCRGPPGQNGCHPNKDAITTQEAISNDLFISNYNPSSLLPNSQTSCYTLRCFVCFLIYYKVSYHSHHSSVIFYC